MIAIHFSISVAVALLPNEWSVLESWAGSDRRDRDLSTLLGSAETQIGSMIRAVTLVRIESLISKVVRVAANKSVWRNWRYTLLF